MEKNSPFVERENGRDQSLTRVKELETPVTKVVQALYIINTMEI